MDGENDSVGLRNFVPLSTFIVGNFLAYLQGTSPDYSMIISRLPGCHSGSQVYKLSDFIYIIK